MLNIITKRTTIKGIVIAFVISFALPLFAQDANTITPPAPRHRQVDPEKVKLLLQKVEEVKHQKLREVLNLDDATSKQFFAEYDPAEKDLIGLVKQRQEQELKLLQLTRGDYKDGDVDPTLQSIKSLNQQIQDRYEKLDNNLKSVLAPRQRAKLLVFEKEFNRKVREKIRDRIERWKANHPGQRPFHRKAANRPAQSTTH
jgi:Spy/CpxP family protein refolding chaperone